jgi:hypothetical protein
MSPTTTSVIAAVVSEKLQPLCVETLLEERVWPAATPAQSSARTDFLACTP